MNFAFENEDGSFKERIFTTENVEWDETHLCPVSELTEEERVKFFIASFAETSPPTPGQWHSVRELPPVKNNGIWEQQWEVYDLDLTLEAKKLDIKNRIKSISRVKRDMLAANIGITEMASRPIKRSEALAYRSSGVVNSAPNLWIEAQERGITLAALVEKVLSKAGQLASLEASIAGRCGALRDAVDAATDEAELLAIDYKTGWVI